MSAASNLPPHIFLEHYRECVRLKRDVEQAQGRYRSAVKRAKASGVDQAALIQAMSLVKQDTSAVELHFRNVGRYLAWLESPIGTQGALFGVSDDQRPTEQAAGEHREWAASEAGYEAGKAGSDIAENPFPAGSPHASKWIEGWHSGQAYLAEQLGPDGKKAKGRKRKSGNPEDRIAA